MKCIFQMGGMEKNGFHWFLISLFTSELLYVFIANTFSNSNVFKWIVIFLCFVIGVILGDYNIRIFSFSSSLISLLFFAIGHTLKSAIFQMKKSNLLTILGLCIFFVSSVLLYIYMPFNVNIRCARLHPWYSVFASLGLSLLIIVCIKNVCEILPNKMLKYGAFAYLGKNSLVIYLLNESIISVTNHLLHLKTFVAPLSIIYIAQIGTTFIVVLTIFK